MQNVITLIVKPTNECNFRCAYCYHKDTGYTNGILSYELLEKLIKISLEEYRHVVFVWHGGEPLLCGIEYFRNIVVLQNKYRKDCSKIENSIQTNGSLVNDEVIAFAKQNNFSICTSIDGDERANCLRQNTRQVIDNINCAQEAGINISALGVIHNKNISYLKDTYKFFKALKTPVKLNPVFGTPTDKSDYLISSDIYVEKMKELFDFWINDESAILFEPFMQYLSMYFNRAGRDCIYGSCMTKWLGIDSKGDIYPCGRSYSENYKLGNLKDIIDLSSVFLSEPYMNILKSSILRRSKCQEKCKFYGLCNGGCNNNFILEGNIEESGGFMCETFIALYSYIKEFLDAAIANGTVYKNIYYTKFYEIHRNRQNRCNK